MKLMTKAIEKELAKHPFGSTEGMGLDAPVIVKFFGGSACTWLVTEGEKLGDDWEFFGMVTLDGTYWEYGYFMFSEIANLRFPPFGLGLERDYYFSGKLRDEVRDVVA